MVQLRIIYFRHLNRVPVECHHGNILQHSDWDSDVGHYGEFLVKYR